MPDAEQVGKWASLVPEIYYDLIARVPPGSLVVATLFVWLHPDPHSALIGLRELGWAPVTVLSVIAVGAAYACGELVGPWGDWVSSLYRFRIFRQVSAGHLPLMTFFRQRFGEDVPDQEPDIKKLSDSEVQRIYQQMHDFLKAANEQAKVLLPKSQAEAALCANLCGFVILFLLFSGAWSVSHWFFETGAPPVSWRLVLLLLFGAAVAVRAGWFRSRQLIRRQFSFLALVREQELARKASSAAK